MTVLVTGIVIGFLFNRLLCEMDMKLYNEKIDSLENQLRYTKLAVYADSVCGRKISFSTLINDISYIDSVSKVNGIDYKLVVAIISKESGWTNENLMQVMPTRIRSLGYKDWDMSRHFSIDCGVKTLRYSY